MDTMIEILKFIQSFSNPVLDFIFENITMLGGDVFIIAVVAVTYWCINKTFGFELTYIYLTNKAVNTIIKEIVKFPRPIGYEGIKSSRIETAGGYSFPSDHAQKTTAVFVTLMREIKKKWFNVIAVVIIVLVCLSRMYLGVHWPSDIIFGVVLAFLWTEVAVKVFKWSQHKRNPWLLGILVVPMIICLLFFKTDTYYKIVGGLTAIWLGYIVEGKYIRYEAKAIWRKQIIKLVVGAIGLAVIEVYLKKILPNSIYCDFMRYALIGFWMIVIAPLIFRVLRLEEASTTIK